MTKAHFLRQYFGWEHLPEHMQAISRPFGELAAFMDDLLPDNHQKDQMMHLLIQAKDCAVRAKIHKKSEDFGALDGREL